MLFFLDSRVYLLSLRARRWITVSLSVMLVLLSLAASAHSVSHTDEASSLCTLCIHKHQLNKLVPSSGAPVVPVLLVHEVPVTSLLPWISAEQPPARSRGPPNSP